MRSVRLVALREAAEHPQFVGDDRHLTQGAVELEDLRWDAAAKTYALRVRAVGGFPFSYAVRVPEGYAFKSCTADGAKAETACADGLLRVKVSADVSRTVDVSIRFAR